VDDLDRHFAAQERIPAQVDLTHTPLGEQPDDFELAEAGQHKPFRSMELRSSDGPEFQSRAFSPRLSAATDSASGFLSKAAEPVKGLDLPAFLGKGGGKTR
jgi:hypothetical protein